MIITVHSSDPPQPLTRIREARKGRRSVDIPKGNKWQNSRKNSDPDRINRLWRDVPKAHDKFPVGASAGPSSKPPSQLDTDAMDRMAEAILGDIMNPGQQKGADINAPGERAPTYCYPIVKDYDCTVIISPNSEVIHFQVSAHTLSCSSVILKGLLRKITETSGSDDERRKDKVPSVRLELEGDPILFDMIFRVIHGNAREIPLKNVTFEQFTQIAFLCQRYEWHAALQPWTQYWLEKYEKHALEPGFENWLCETLAIIDFLSSIEIKRQKGQPPCLPSQGDLMAR
ncbi:uncharacterized protein DFL_005793 [Arthrobotrys flagrans]|uniref:BTB domain-containing protein n=1 Tax=Arthrobotrys flagrans TaxID=97331 RepID=A0A436ZZ35_ARTFL|nr:hypothetical protein DFL_005793 [Arthrobotrys flagrans]